MKVKISTVAIVIIVLVLSFGLFHATTSLLMTREYVHRESQLDNLKGQLDLIDIDSLRIEWENWNKQFVYSTSSNIVERFVAEIEMPVKNLKYIKDSKEFFSEENLQRFKVGE